MPQTLESVKADIDDAIDYVAEWIREQPHFAIDKDEFNAGRTCGWSNVQDLLYDIRRGTYTRRAKGTKE